MAETQHQLDSNIGRSLHGMIEHIQAVIATLVVVSLVLVVIGISLAPDKDVSFNPAGDEFETEDLVAATFRPSTTEWVYIVEADDGDALDRGSLLEWKQDTDALRADSELSGALSTYFDSDLGITVEGTYTLADAVDEELRAMGVANGLAGADDDATKQALAAVLSDERPTALFRDLLSVSAEATTANVGGQQIDLYTSPAFLSMIRVDHADFPVDLESESDPETRTLLQQQEIDAARDLEIEEYARDVQDVLRGDEQNIDVWGLAIDGGLTSDESFTSTIPFLLGAFMLIVLLVGGLLHSYWAAATAGVMLGLTLLWSRMITNIIGFEESIILDVIVPIATISFGVDFMIHAVGRCREELATGTPYRHAYAIGIATVGGALVLALSTSAIAFGSNATSGIDGVIEFGFGAAIALASAFLMLGILAPMFMLRLEEFVTGAPPTGPGPLARIGSGLRVLIAAAFASVVLLSTIAVPFVAAVGVAIYALVFLVAPAYYTRRHARRHAAIGTAAGTVNTAGQTSGVAGSFVSSIVRYRYAALGVLAAITAVAAFGATKVGSKTDPADFLPSNSDMVVSIDKALEHSGSLSAGGVLIYAEGDLAAPEAMRAAATTVESVGAAGGELFVQNPDGSFAAPTSFLDVARVAVAVDFTRSSIEDATGVAITDEDSDGFPDNAEQVAAVFNYGLENGLPADENSFIFTADEVGQQVAELDSGWAAVMDFPLQGLGSSERVQSAREAVEAGEADFLSATSAAGLTMDTSISGSILTEQLRLDAITDSMVISVPLAMLLCLAVAGLVMRSLMISLVSVVPIILVIAWLLGFMYAFDYNLNVVTATIAAISVGVGIDYSIHFTMRYREELVRTGDRMEAAGGAASRTGTALVLSGATSIVGFLLLALAPMPVFAAYGLLTAMMIAFSLIAALTVLPALLSIVTPAAQTSSQASTVRAEA